MSYHYSIGIINKLFEAIENPFEQSKAFNSAFIHDYISRWIHLVKEYSANAKSTVQWEVFAESLVKTH